MNTKIFMITLLRELKISPKHLGDTYLQSCIMYVFENKKSLKSLSKMVYPIIAEEYDATEKSIEKAISNAIEKAYSKGGMKTLVFDGCPTNKEVISFVVSKMTEQSYKSTFLNVSNF